MTGSVSAQKQQTLHSGYPIDPVPFTSVKVTDSFWGQRLKASREVTIPLAFSKCEETGRYENFVKATHPSDEYKVGGFSFDDTDVYKTIEGASYSLQTYPDKKLEEYIDSVLVIVAAAQEPDGYLYTARTMNPKHPHDWSGPERWSEVENLSHEFYNLGHMVEGAVAYYQATGKRNFLDIAIRYADCVCKNIGEGPGQKRVIPGHQIAEMALVRLYTVTGDKKYLDQAKFFLDARGIEYRILFLDASDDVLVKRYKETRRTHPLAGLGRVDEGIRKERKALEFLKKDADYILDTSQLLTRELKAELDKIFVQDQKFKNLMITVLSFGFKYGIPADSDLVFDVRFLPNPYYVEGMRPLSGNDAPVRDYVMGFETAQVFAEKLEDMIRFLIPNYISEGKHQLIISIGCTGGKHRSVTLANELYRRLSNAKDYGIRIEHRDLEKDAIRKGI